MFKRRDSAEVRVEHGGATFVFAGLTAKEDIDFTQYTANRLSEGIDYAMSKLVRVEGAKFEDGEEISADNVMSLDTADVIDIFNKYCAVRTEVALANKAKKSKKKPSKKK